MPPRYIDSLTNPKIRGFRWQDPEDDSDRKTFRDILEYGCQILEIQAEPNSPEFSYSVGLYLNFLHPEILIIGLSSQTCRKAINQICREAADGKKIIKAGDVRSDLFESQRPVRFVEVDKKFYPDYLGYALWFYRSLFFQRPLEPKFPVLQAVWPDKDMRYPDDPACNRTVKSAQTLTNR